MTKIISADGSRSVVAFDMKHDERLLPSQVASFDRRLGISTRWASIGDGD